MIGLRHARVVALGDALAHTAGEVRGPGCAFRGTGKIVPQGDDERAADDQHLDMPIVPSRRRPFAAVAMLLILAALAAGCGSGNSNSGTGTPETGSALAVQTQYTKVVADLSPQVVQIQTSQGLGSGIVYDNKGDVVTNAHVAGNSKQFLVTLPGGAKRQATLVGSDVSNDLAVIHVSGNSPAPAPFADSSSVKPGEIVFAIGNPLGLQSSVTQGIVSSINRQVNEGNGVTLSNVLQTSAEINPGNSGGALVDLDGQVVGIPTLDALDPEFGNTPAAGIGFAIPSNKVRQIADGLISGGT
jgi:putative serine protease PepD